MREIMGKLKLTVNEEKTRICKVPAGQFDFLGYTFGRVYSKTTGKARLGMWPSKNSIRRMVAKVHDLTDLKTGWQETTVKVAKLNRALRGWRIASLQISRVRSKTARPFTGPLARTLGRGLTAALPTPMKRHAGMLTRSAWRKFPPLCCTR
jgi:hypothetical protein